MDFFWSKFCEKKDVSLISPITFKPTNYIIPKKIIKNPNLTLKQNIKDSIREIFKYKVLPNLYYDKESDFAFFDRPKDEFIDNFYKLGETQNSNKAEDFLKSESMSYVANDIINWYKKKSCNQDSLSNVADFGAGSGWLSISLAKSFKNVTSTDFSLTSIEHIAKFNNKIKLKSLDNFFNDEDSYDAIFSYDVFEHLSYPRNELIKLSKKINKGGFLFISVPNFNSLFFRQNIAKHPYFSYPAHLNYFTKFSLFNLLKITGFKNILIESTSVYYEPEYIGRNYSKEFYKNDSWRLADEMLIDGNGERLFALATKD